MVAARDRERTLARIRKLFGFRLDRALDWDELAGIVEDAYAEVAPPKLVEQMSRTD